MHLTHAAPLSPNCNFPCCPHAYNSLRHNLDERQTTSALSLGWYFIWFKAHSTKFYVTNSVKNTNFKIRTKVLQATWNWQFGFRWSAYEKKKKNILAAKLHYTTKRLDRLISVSCWQKPSLSAVTTSQTMLHEYFEKPGWSTDQYSLALVQNF